MELVSVGDSGSITVNVDEQSMTIATPNGLPGIPVSSGGNYTDASGQQWVCDEIDFARGVHVQRVFQYVCTGNEKWSVSQYQYSGGGIRYDGIANMSYDELGGKNVLCTHFVDNGVGRVGTWVNDVASNSTLNLRILQKESVFASVDDLVMFLKGEHAKGTPVRYLCSLRTPIETPLSAEALAFYASLHENKEAITVSNDSDVYMVVEYFLPYEVFNEGVETSKPIMVLKGEGSVVVSVNGLEVFSYSFPEGENEVVIDSEKEDAYLGDVLKNRNMNGEFPVLLPGTNIIEWSGYVSSIEILPRSRWL